MTFFSGVGVILTARYVYIGIVVSESRYSIGRNIEAEAIADRLSVEDAISRLPNDPERR